MNSLGGRLLGMITSLQAEYPAWHLWRSDGGCWWATRRHRISDRQLAAGYEATVCGDDLDGLWRALERQRAIERSTMGAPWR